MKKSSFFLIFIVIINLSCKSQSSSNNTLSSIDISNFQYGKISLPYSQIDYLSKTLKINKKQLTSSLYYHEGSILVSIPINDKVFNYEYFNNFKYNIEVKAKLYIQKYTYENREYFVAVRIE